MLRNAGLDVIYDVAAFIPIEGDTGRVIVVWQDLPPCATSIEPREVVFKDLSKKRGVVVAGRSAGTGGARGISR